MANSTVLTAEGRKKLEEELAWREGEHRTEIVERIKVARDFGDLSENSEYDDAKDEQAKNEARIHELHDILANAIDSDAAGLSGAALGSTVTVVDGEGEVQSFTLVGTNETDSLNNKISTESPIGAALINREEGETVEVVLPSGKTRVFTITKITR